MKVLMTGGTGFLGSALRRKLEERGDSITVLSRMRAGSDGATKFVPIDSLESLGMHDVVINLAGESVVGLWTGTKRRAIYDSRIDTTRMLAEWIERSSRKPRVFLSGSAVGIYGDAGDRELNERSNVSNVAGFLAKVCRDWENAASAMAWRGTRTVLLRTGQVLDPSGGLLGKTLPLMRRLPIVVMGTQSAYVPWIALEDWVDLALHAIENESVSGPLNLTAPAPVTQAQFTEAVARRLGKRVWGRIPRLVLRLAAGEFGDSICYSQRAIPEGALQAGYCFKHEVLDGYLNGIF